jgi:hypothetical protein
MQAMFSLGEFCKSIETKDTVLQVGKIVMNSHRVFIQTLPYLPYIESVRERYVRTQYTSILMANRFVVK